MAQAPKVQQVIVTQPPPTRTSPLPIDDGKPPSATNQGGILVMASSTSDLVQAPTYRVPFGMIVRVRGNPANTKNVMVSLVREDLLLGRGDQIGPNTEIIYPVDNTGVIWALFQNDADQLAISIRNQ